MRRAGAVLGRRTRALAIGAAVVLPLATAACSGPITASRIDAGTVHHRLTRSALSSGELTHFTRNVLLQTDLDELFEDEPDKALERLHDVAVSGSGWPGALFAAAEASFLHAQRTGRRPYFLAATLYAWTYLFPENRADAPSPFDPRFRLAANIYNRGLTSALESLRGEEVAVREGPLELPFGTLTIAFDRAQLTWHGRRMTAFTPIAEFDVSGLRAYYREPGIGAPLAASLAPPADQARLNDLLRPELTLPVTALLRLPRSRTGLAYGQLRGTLELHVPDDSDAVDIGGQRVPLENEPTAVLAYSLADSPIWDQEYRRFFQVLQFRGGEQSELYATVPHRSGRTPVVFVHGTASSFGRWAEMYNRLAADPRLRARYEFWFFSYDSGSPVTWSAMLLRESLKRAVELLDPKGTDAGLRRMVLIGHSQGGLLAKMAVVDSGSRFWDLNFKEPIEVLRVTPETRELLRRSAFVTPLLFVKRVIFLATPHHGSYLSVGRIAQWVTRFMQAPLGLTKAMADVLTRNRDALVLAGAEASPRVPTSLDQMNPNNPFLRVLAELPIAPGVAANSIIAVQGTGPVEDGEDGVVKYRSAHIKGVESELVIRSGHSLQDQPGTVEEVRRILLLHAAQAER